MTRLRSLPNIFQIWELISLLRRESSGGKERLLGGGGEALYEEDLCRLRAAMDVDGLAESSDGREAVECGLDVAVGFAGVLVKPIFGFPLEVELREALSMSLFMGRTAMPEPLGGGTGLEDDDDCGCEDGRDGTGGVRD